MKKISRQDAIYRVALTGISSAVALLFVWLSVLVRFSTIAFMIAAGLAVAVPLTKRYILPSFIAYAVSAGLGFLIAGDLAAVAGYIIYFGPISLITGILYNVHCRWYIALPIKIVYINGALALLYFVCGTIVVSADVIGKIPYWAVALVGTVALVAIDYVFQFIYSRLVPIMNKILRSKRAEVDSAAPVDEDDEIADPYSGDIFADAFGAASEDAAEADEPSDIEVEARADASATKNEDDGKISDDKDE